ncbi:uncharacterized protein LOC126819376 [Patella vulgata]|uniref:uncharacterized protein LOC126819376 n=1 Tax=Patella vulgata TaxID=6465 RepID=UPI00217F2CFE|nr:uncharacterized protein LOC126819376 [Patella vulgata]
MSHYHDQNSITLDLHRQGRFAYLEPGARLSTAERGKFRCHNTHCVLLGVTILLSISASVMSGVVFIKLNFSLPENQDNGKICFTTTELKLSPFRDEESEIEKLSKEVNNDQFVYCASTPEQMQIILNWVIDNKTKAYVDKYYDNVTNNLLEGNAVCAHVLIHGSDVLGVNKNAVKLLKSRSLSHYDGINIGPHKLVIKTKGTYFLYSQIYFKLIPGVNYHQPINTSLELFHQVVRFRQSSPTQNGQEELLRNEHQTRVKKGEVDFRSSFVSGTFEMVAGDQIGVMVTNLDYISRKPETNFIGLFLLGNDA